MMRSPSPYARLYLANDCAIGRKWAPKKGESHDEQECPISDITKIDANEPRQIFTAVGKVDIFLSGETQIPTHNE
jgi:hypothetical protein